MMKLFQVPVITPQETAQRTGVPVQTIFAWLRKGVLTGYKLAGRYYVPESAIQELVKDACVSKRR
jgi:excisionase family DNA binding protein